MYHGCTKKMKQQAYREKNNVILSLNDQGGFYTT